MSTRPTGSGSRQISSRRWGNAMLRIATRTSLASQKWCEPIGTRGRSEFIRILRISRDRSSVARELLADSGSVFVQISDENLHRVRLLLDEVFGASNFVVIIIFVTTQADLATTLSFSVTIFSGMRERSTELKYRQVFQAERAGRRGAGEYKRYCCQTDHLAQRQKDELAEARSLPDGAARDRFGTLTSRVHRVSREAHSKFSGQ